MHVSEYLLRLFQGFYYFDLLQDLFEGIFIAFIFLSFLFPSRLSSALDIDYCPLS